MAIGDNNNNSNSNGGNNKLFESTYYSRLRFKQAEGKLALTPSFRSGLLILDISELKEGFKYESLISIYLSPTKARILAGEIKRFKEYLASGNIEPNRAFGVNAGMNNKVSFIGFHTDKDKTIFVTIGKVDENGNITEQVTTNLNKDYHYGLEWNNITTMDVVKEYNDNIEIDQLFDLCYDFGRNMSGATAYSHVDLARFDYARMLKKMDPIFDKLGIERYNSGNSNSGSRNNFFDNAKSSNSNHTSFENVEDLLEND